MLEYDQPQLLLQVIQMKDDPETGWPRGGIISTDSNIRVTLHYATHYGYLLLLYRATTTIYRQLLTNQLLF